VQRLVDTIEKDGYGARTLIREIVLSVPFRNTQGAVESTGPAKPLLKRSTRKLLGEK
jgi:hypothetical protein